MNQAKVTLFNTILLSAQKYMKETETAALSSLHVKKRRYVTLLARPSAGGTGWMSLRGNLRFS